MNKLQWHNYNSVRQLLIFSKPSLRKVKLLAVHCLDHNKQYFNFPESLRALKLLQSYADGKITTSKLDREFAKLRSNAQVDGIINAYSIISRNHFDIHWAASLCDRAAHLKYYVTHPNYNENCKDEIIWECNLLRHMVRPNFTGE